MNNWITWYFSMKQDRRNFREENFENKYSCWIYLRKNRSRDGVYRNREFFNAWIEKILLKNIKKDR